MKNDFGKNFEKKFSKYAIPNLSLYLVLCYAFGYLIQTFSKGSLDYFILNPAMVLKGQVWRLFTWIIVPPNKDNLLLVIIMLYFFYTIGTILEKIWGAYRYNLYIFSGILYTVIGSFLLYILSIMLGKNVASWDVFNTFYVNMSIFLAFAAIFPEKEILLMYVIPIKVKHLGIIYGIYLGAQCLLGGIGSLVVIGSSLFNFLVFFFTSRNRIRMSPKQMKQRQQFRKEVHYAARITRHKCAICGRTEETNPELEFRFCSKCNGNFEYCQDHLFTHKHVE